MRGFALALLLGGAFAAPNTAPWVTNGKKNKTKASADVSDKPRPKKMTDADWQALIEERVNKVAPNSQARFEPHKRGKYGFYLHIFAEPAAILEQMKSVRKFFPTSPVYVMSDGGINATGACAIIGNCLFDWRPPANDRWNPKPFFRRFRDAARWLDTDYVIMLEPDVAVQGPIEHEPQDDAGGIADKNPPLHQSTIDYVEALGRRVSGNASFQMKWNRFGLAGGTYVRTDAALDAFDPDFLDWGLLQKMEMTHRVFSSDVAMVFLLTAKGYSHYPWADLSQKRYYKEMYDAGRSTPFRHYGREEVKPGYGVRLDKEDRALFSEGPKNRGEVTCQGCVFTDDDSLCYPEGEKIACPISGPRASLLGLDNLLGA